MCANKMAGFKTSPTESQADIFLQKKTWQIDILLQQTIWQIVILENNLSGPDLARSLLI